MTTTATPSAPTGTRIFGREPAFVVGLIESVLALLVSFHLAVDAQHVGLIMAVVVAAFGAYTAWATKDTLLGALIGVAKALVALAVGYGLHLSPEQAGSILAVVTVAFALYNRSQTSPVAYPADPSPQPVIVTDAAGEPVPPSSDGPVVEPQAAATLSGRYEPRHADDV